MRPGTRLIHTRFVYCSLFYSASYVLKQLLFCLYVDLRQTMHKYPCLRVFSYLQILQAGRGRVLWWLAQGRQTPLAWISRKQQISYLLHIDFKKTNCDSELGFVRVLLDIFKYMVHSARDYSRLVCQVGVRLTAKNSVSFPTAGLTLSHNHPIKPVKNVLGQWFG